MLIANPNYAWTVDEITDVVFAKLTQLQTAAIVCNCCGLVKLWISRDTGITAKWGPAANVIDRLRQEKTIDGVMS